MQDLDFKKFVESYRCRLCKIPLTLDNFGGLGPNHGIFCEKCIERKDEWATDDMYKPR
jgi:hypothetical protein